MNNLKIKKYLLRDKQEYPVWHNIIVHACCECLKELSFPIAQFLCVKNLVNECLVIGKNRKMLYGNFIRALRTLILEIILFMTVRETTIKTQTLKNE